MGLIVYGAYVIQMAGFLWPLLQQRSVTFVFFAAHPKVWGHFPQEPRFCHGRILLTSCVSRNRKGCFQDRLVCGKTKEKPFPMQRFVCCFTSGLRFSRNRLLIFSPKIATMQSGNRRKT
jgi:hypothetical protein